MLVDADAVLSMIVWEVTMSVEADLATQVSALEALFAVMSDGVSVYDTTGRLVRMNTALRRMLALDADSTSRYVASAECAQPLDVRDEQGRPLPEQEWPCVRALQGEELVGEATVNTVVTTLDGRKLFLNTSGTPMRDQEGHIIGAVCVSRDISEQHHLEQELAARARQIDAIFDAIPDGLGFFDAQGSILRFNQAATALFGANRHENLEAIPDAYGVRTLAGAPFPIEDLPLARVLREERGDATEMRVRLADGSEQIVSVQAAPWYGPPGTIEGVVVVAHDTTLLHQAEQDAAAQASDLEAIFNAMTDGVYVNDATGRLVRVNEAGRTLAALEMPRDGSIPVAADLIAAAAARDSRGHSLAPAQWPLTRVLQGEMLMHENSVDMVVHTLDGQDRLVNISGAPVHDATGRIVRAVLVVRDVTERRTFERRTRAALDALLEMARALVLAPSSEERENATAQDQVAPRLAELTRNVLGCTRVGIVTYDLQANVQHPIAVAGLSSKQEQDWWANIEGTPIVDPRVPVDPDLMARLSADEVIIVDMTQAPYCDQPNPFGIRTVLVAPLRINGSLIGILSLDYGAQRTTTPPTKSRWPEPSAS